MTTIIEYFGYDFYTRFPISKNKLLYFSLIDMKTRYCVVDTNSVHVTFCILYNLFKSIE